MKYLTNLWQSKRSVHIGLIAKCEKHHNYGLIFGFRKAPYGDGKQKAREHKIFYFEKDVDLEIEKNTLVSYLSYDYNTFSPKAERVYPIEELISHHDCGGTKREDGDYHDDITWKLINEEKPFIDYYDRDCIIYYPTIENDICYIWEGLLGIGMYWNIEGYIYKMYDIIQKINYKGWPSLEKTTEKINEFKNYIDSINVNDIIDTYEVKRIEWYQSRQGKDYDFFHIDIIPNLDSDDKYLQYLLPLEEDNGYIEVSPSESYKYFKAEKSVYLLEEETKAAKDRARLEYSKETHLAYLIRDYFRKFYEEKLYITKLQNDIYYQFDVENANVVLAKFRGWRIEDIRFQKLLDKYNECKEDKESKEKIL